MSSPHHRAALIAALALACVTANARAAVLLNENFDTRIDAVNGSVKRCSGLNGPGSYPMPDGWLLRDVDAHTPADGVNWVQHAWEVREDYRFDSAHCAVFSTSWYVPNGTADDWMWTPALAVPASGALLSWRAIAYDAAYADGYEVRVMSAPATPGGGTATLGNEVSQSTQVFGVASESGQWTSHSLSLNAFANHTIYVGFRNHSTNMYVLGVDDVRVNDNSPDAAARAPTGEAYGYATLPIRFAPAVTLGFVANNPSNVTLTNVRGSAQLLHDGVAVGAPVLSQAVASVAVGGSAPVPFAMPVTLSGNGVWSVVYHVITDASQPDSDASNDTVTVPLTTIGGIDWSRSEGLPDTSAAIGSGETGDIGVSFTLDHTEAFEGVRYIAIGSGTVNSQVAARLWATDANGKPTLVIAQTPTLLARAESVTYTQLFQGGKQTLAPGTYVVTVAQMGAENVALAFSPRRFVAGNTWTNFPSSPFHDWAHLEDFGSGFARAPAMSLRLADTIFRHDFETLDAMPAATMAAMPASKYALPPLSAVRKP